MGRLRIEPATGTVPTGSSGRTQPASGTVSSRVGYAWSDSKKIVFGGAGVAATGALLGAAVPPVGAVEITLAVVGGVGSGLTLATGIVGFISNLFAPASTNQQVHDAQPLTSIGGIAVELVNAVRGAPTDDEAARIDAEAADKIVDLLKTLAEPSKLVEAAEKTAEKIEQVEGWNTLADGLRSPAQPEAPESGESNSDENPGKQTDASDQSGSNDKGGDPDETDKGDNGERDSGERDSGSIERAGHEDRIFFA